jgi:hypothetical protein
MRITEFEELANLIWFRKCNLTNMGFVNARSLSFYLARHINPRIRDATSHFKIVWDYERACRPVNLHQMTTKIKKVLNICSDNPTRFLVYDPVELGVVLEMIAGFAHEHGIASQLSYRTLNPLERAL